MSYFPQHYFPTGAAPVTGAGTGDDLLSEIKLYFDAQPQLLAISGGLFLQQAGDRATPPYALVEKSGYIIIQSTDVSLIYNCTISFTTYAYDLDQASDQGQLIFDAFKGRGFTWTRGTASPFVPQDDAHRKDPNRGQQTNRVWHNLRDFQTRVKIER